MSFILSTLRIRYQLCLINCIGIPGVMPELIRIFYVSSWLQAFNLWKWIHNLNYITMITRRQWEQAYKCGILWLLFKTRAALVVECSRSTSLLPSIEVSIITRAFSINSKRTYELPQQLPVFKMPVLLFAWFGLWPISSPVRGIVWYVNVYSQALLSMYTVYNSWPYRQGHTGWLISLCRGLSSFY